MKRAQSLILVGALTTTTLFAFIGIGPGLPVFDQMGFMEKLVQTGKLVAQIGLIAETNVKLAQQYSHMVQQAKSIANLYRYATPTHLWRGFSGTNIYGKTGKWIAAINSGIDTLEAWQAATTEIRSYPDGLASIPLSQRTRREVDFAGLELQEGAAVSAMDTIGRTRASGLGIEKIVAILETDSLSADPEMQTEAAQLNKANAIALIQTKALSDQNKLLVTNAELALIRLRQDREASAYALANDVAFRTDGKAALEAQHAGASSAMMAYRLP